MISAFHNISSAVLSDQYRRTSPILASPVVRWFSREIPLSSTSRRLSNADYQVPRIARAGWHKSATTETVAQKALDLSNARLVPAISDIAEPEEKTAKRPRSPRSPVPSLVPLPITERDVITFKEAAAIGPKTENALRHMAFMVSAYEKLGFEGKPYLAEFAGCIYRPLGQRRIYLNRQRLLAFFTGNGGCHV